MIAVANSFTAKTIRCVPHLREIQMFWTYNAFRSDGMQEFVEKFLPDLRRNNPHVRFTIHRTNVLCDTWLVGVYQYIRKRKYRLNGRTANQILAYVEEMSIGGHFRVNRGVNTFVPRGLFVFDKEQRGHDVYKVFSKLTW